VYRKNGTFYMFDDNQIQIQNEKNGLNVIKPSNINKGGKTKHKNKRKHTRKYTRKHKVM